MPIRSMRGIPNLILCSIASMHPLGDASGAPPASESSARNVEAYNLSGGRLAIAGFDPVGYFREGGGAPVKGDQRFEFTHNGALYRFASQAHLDLFKAHPDRYEPAHGGWCSYAMGKKGSKVEVDPTSYLVADNRLFLFYKSFFNDTRASFVKDRAALTQAADANWKKLTGEDPRGDEMKTRPSTGDGAARRFALIELFTSEGCSSCPPADRVLSDLRGQARMNSSPIYAIAFHVDYWNRLGWRDRFSSPEYSARQHEYRAAMGLSSIYTPQMVINGRAEFNGSDRSRADREITRALGMTAPVAVTASLAARRPGEPFNVEVASPDCPDGAKAYAALVEDGLSTQVAAGENSGRRLEHDGVVRALVSAPIGEGSGTRLTLDPPADFNDAKASILVFIQERESMHVLGATALPAGRIAAAIQP